MQRTPIQGDIRNENADFETIATELSQNSSVVENAIRTEEQTIDQPKNGDEKVDSNSRDGKYVGDEGGNFAERDRSLADSRTMKKRASFTRIMTCHDLSNSSLPPPRKVTYMHTHISQDSYTNLLPEWHM